MNVSRISCWTGDLSSEDHRDLVRLSDGSIGIQETFPHLVQCGATAQDEVIAKFDLSEEQTVLATSVFALPFREERRERGQPLLAAVEQVGRGERIGQFLQSGRVGAFQKSVGAWLKVEPLFAQANCEPVRLIEADARRKRQVGAHRTNRRPQCSSLR